MSNSLFVRMFALELTIRWYVINWTESGHADILISVRYTNKHCLWQTVSRLYRLQLKFANLYHVDDPRAANAVKDEEALKLIPAAERKSADYFPKKQTNAEITSPAKTKLSADEMNDL